MENIFCKVIDLPKEVYKQLYSLNYRANGLMRSELVAGRKDPSYEYYVTYAIDAEGEVKSWVLAMKNQYDVYARPLTPEGSRPRDHQLMSNVYNIHFWTRKSCRRQGIGGSVFKTLKESLPADAVFKVFPHDYSSHNFMRSKIAATPGTKVME